MHYASHVLMYCIAFWCTTAGGGTIRSAVSPEILANFAKNVASVISPAILGDLQNRTNRSTVRAILAIPAGFNEGNVDSSSTQDNVIDKTSRMDSYHTPHLNSYHLSKLHDESSTESFGRSRTNEDLGGLLSDYLSQGRSNYYDQPYNSFSQFDDLKKIEKPVVSDNIQSSLGSIEQSSTNRHNSYHKFNYGPYGGKPYGGFHGFGPYGNYHHDHSYDYANDDAPSDENNGTNRRAYGLPHVGGYYGHHHPYSPYPYGGHYGHGYGHYGPHHGNGNGNGNDTAANGQNGDNGHYGYGPYHGGYDFYGPPGYGYDHGYHHNGNGNGNGNGNNARQTEEPAENGDRNNMTKNGYPHPYGPPLGIKPFPGAFHFHGFPTPFSILPYDQFHFKGGLVAGVGHVGYPIYADPYLIGFPFHHPYGPFFHGKKYLPPKGKNHNDSGESGEQESAGELMNGDNPERVTINQEEAAPASSSNRYETLKRLQRLNLINLGLQKV